MNRRFKAYYLNISSKKNVPENANESPKLCLPTFRPQLPGKMVMASLSGIVVGRCGILMFLLVRSVGLKYHRKHQGSTGRSLNKNEGYTSQRQAKAKLK